MPTTAAARAATPATAGTAMRSRARVTSGTAPLNDAGGVVASAKRATPANDW